MLLHAIIQTTVILGIMATTLIGIIGVITIHVIMGINLIGTGLMGIGKWNS